MDGIRDLPAGRLALGWVSAVGVDLLFHAGLFSPVFNASREPGLLPEQVLFRRIPFAYAFLAVMAFFVGWLIRRLELPTGSAAGAGAAVGGVIGVVGYGGLWTAVEVTGLLVVAGTLVLTLQGATIGWVTAAERPGKQLGLVVTAFFFGCAVAGQVAANLLA